MAAVDHLVELQLQGREGGQRAADTGPEEGVGEALLRVVAEEGEEVAEQQRPGHVDGEGRPGPGAGAVRRRLRQADPDQRPDDAAEVDRRQSA